MSDHDDLLARSYIARHDHPLIRDLAAALRAEREVRTRAETRLAATQAGIDRLKDAYVNLLQAFDALPPEHSSAVMVRQLENTLAEWEAEDREPQPGDGPDYHADHQAWAERQALLDADMPETDR